jgi:hypothetical protein
MSSTSLFWHQNTALLHPIAPPPPPVAIDEQQEWEVMVVVDSKPRGRGVVYLVDWVAYGPEECLWLPLANLRHAMDLVHAFNQDHPAKSQSPSYTH